MVTDSSSSASSKAGSSCPRVGRTCDVADVAVDAEDRVFVFVAAPNPVIIYAPDGTFERSWGDGTSRIRTALRRDPTARLHGDDGQHTVRQFDARGGC